MITFQFCARLTRDPEKKGAVTKFSIACDQGIGEKRRGVFYDCIAFGKTGERVFEMWGKGKPMFGTGRVEQDEWEKDGVKQRKTVLVVESAHFVPSDSTQRGERPQPQQDRGFDDGDSVPF